MSYDHRIVDGSAGAGFLSALAKTLESWDPNRQWFQYV
jgi:2-oxoglutarate dehydrogenase E2 component (dihydrolipoamide succinyltransferase)